MTYGLSLRLRNNKSIIDVVLLYVLLIDVTKRREREQRFNL